MELLYKKGAYVYELGQVRSDDVDMVWFLYWAYVCNLTYEAPKLPRYPKSVVINLDISAII